MSTEFHRGDVYVTRFFSGAHGSCVYQLHKDTYTLAELKQLRVLIRALIKNNGAHTPKRRKGRDSDRTNS